MPLTRLTPEPVCGKTRARWGQIYLSFEIQRFVPMKESPRIAVFDDWLPFHMGIDQRYPESDDPIVWSEFINNPRFELTGESEGRKSYRLNDLRAINEIHRLLKYHTCPICRSRMTQRAKDFNEIIYVCLTCGYWGGRGSRMDNVYHDRVPLRGVLGMYKPLEPLSNSATEYLVTHLRKFPEELPRIGPRRAEQFVMDLLADFLKCEVRLAGGSKDKGVDGYVINGNGIKTIVQIKWRENSSGAESVKVVREVAGTLLARGVPAGILVSNRDHYSADAIADARLISKMAVEKLGNFELTLVDYHNILDMLEISNTKLTTGMKVDDWVNIDMGYEVFEGAMMLSDKFVNMFTV